jgi:hypothetical protein
MKSKKEHGLFIECFDKDLEVNEYAQSIVLHIGTPIMSCKNNKKENILNNQEFTVTGWNDQVIHTGSMDIKILDFQKMFVVAYATTVHKAQGASHLRFQVLDLGDLENGPPDAVHGSHTNDQQGSDLHREEHQRVAFCQNGTETNDRSGGLR